MVDTQPRYLTDMGALLKSLSANAFKAADLGVFEQIKHKLNSGEHVDSDYFIELVNLCIGLCAGKLNFAEPTATRCIVGAHLHCNANTMVEIFRLCMYSDVIRGDSPTVEQVLELGGYTMRQSVEAGINSLETSFYEALPRRKLAAPEDAALYERMIGYFQNKNRQLDTAICHWLVGRFYALHWKNQIDYSTRLKKIYRSWRYLETHGYHQFADRLMIALSDTAAHCGQHRNWQLVKTLCQRQLTRRPSSIDYAIFCNFGQFFMLQNDLESAAIYYRMSIKSLLSTEQFQQIGKIITRTRWSPESPRFKRALLDNHVVGDAIADAERLLDKTFILERLPLINGVIDEYANFLFISGDTHSAFIWGRVLKSASNVETEFRQIHLRSAQQQKARAEVLARQQDILKDNAAFLERKVTERTEALQREINHRRKAEFEARRIANTDPLTNLPNRRAFRRDIERVMNENGQFSAIYIDLRRFRRVNNDFGHHMGDKILCQSAKVLGQLSKGLGSIYRLGGDEFICLTVIPIQAAALDTLLSQFEQQLAAEYPTLGLSISIGAASYPIDGDSIDEVLSKADLALTRSKVSKRTEVFSLKDFAKQVRARSLQRDFNGADRRGEIDIYYQLVYDTKENAVYSAEALFRWNHPTLGLLLPSDMTNDIDTLITETGIGNFLIDSAMQKFKPIYDDFKIPLQMNVSARQVVDAGFVDHLLDSLARAQLPATALTIEMTESTLLESASRAKSVLSSLRERGIRIAIDDFGKGFSSLSYLSTLEFDIIKVDGSFIRSLDSSIQDLKITDTIIQLASTLGKDVIAECVEENSQLTTLQNLGCHLIQGYLISHPSTSQKTLESCQQLAKTGY
ncbi:MAG: bifunctional diguanylate cyclase/phosphodiesterase [Gammaproteobacteria bacterium]|nr:bifunctional diguanylate cyclase/phosphodiesterase [Gammaproteobacteria bacterium]